MQRKLSGWKCGLAGSFVPTSLFHFLKDKVEKDPQKIKNKHL